MKPSPTDNHPLPHLWRNLLPLTGLTVGQVRTIYALTHQRLPTPAGRPWGLPLPTRALPVRIHLPTNLTTRALAALFATSQSTVDRIIHHLVPMLADALRPNPAGHDAPWIIDGTLIHVHDQSITAPSKNYRRGINTQIIICADQRHVVTVGHCWPGNRNDVIVARHTIAHLLDGQRPIFGDGGYRGIPTITTPRRDHTGHTIRDQLANPPSHQGPRRTRHRPAQRLANTDAMPPTSTGHQPQPPGHRRAVEPQDTQPITGQLLGPPSAKSVEERAAHQHPDRAAQPGHVVDRRRER
jgi:hypothetical protein